MSAFIVTDKHITTLAKAYVRFIVLDGRRTPEQNEVMPIAKTLLAANIKSVNARYNESTKMTKIDADVDYHYTPIQLIKLIHCLDYQSCEYTGWENSKDKKMLNKLELYLFNAMINDNKDYDAGEWTI